MATTRAASFSHPFNAGLDEFLYEVCEELQLNEARYDLAVDRYNTLNRLLEGKESPFRYFRPEIYPQGSMALGTTVKPIDGPHDLDFVLQLSPEHDHVDPMALIRTLYEFLRQHDRYRPMTSLKKRCVRIEYADEFYMDVLPACRNSAAGGTCIRVPDRAVTGWSDSNPRGYISWFKDMCRVFLAEGVLAKAEPIPDQEAVGEKSTLQLVVQLIKRWRDLYYANAQDLAPISIVLTTLAAHTYGRQPSVSRALTSVLEGINDLVGASRRAGEEHLRVLNPANPAEDLSERWDSNLAAYQAFEKGIRAFSERWSQLTLRGGNVDADLKALYGEPVSSVLRKRAIRLQENRSAGRLGITSAGIITSTAAANMSIKPNTFYGEE
jgi:hypothetical protein